MTKNVILTALVALVVSVGAIALAPGQSNLGGLSERDVRAVSIQVGQDGSVKGTKLTFVKTGTCTLLSNFSIAATSTRSVDCAISGVRSGDLVDLVLAPSTALAQQYVIKSSSASTTAGYASAQLINLTGGAAVPSATSGFGSSTVYKIYRAVN